MKKADTYKEVRTYHYAHAIVRVHIPDLSPEGRCRRMQKIYKASADLIAADEQAKRESQKQGFS